VRALVERFEETYEAVYGRGAGFREAGVELTTFRVEAIGRTPKPSIRGPVAATTPFATKREIFEPVLERWVSSSIYQWLSLPVGYRVAGPAVIEHPETTVYVGVGQTAQIDPAGNLDITFEGIVS